MITSKRSRFRMTVGAMALLMLMLSSQVATRSQETSSAQQPEQPASQAPAQPASVPPPKSSIPAPLIYTNTWNRTLQTTSCIPASPATPNPMKPQSQSWTLNASVPLVLAGGAPSAQSVGYTYTAFANGTFLTSDNEGNSLWWKGITGLPSDLTTIRLSGNATEAVQVYTIGPPGKNFANLTVSYRLMQTPNGCEPKGVKITIAGTINWPGGSSGILRIAFGGARLTSNSTQVSFGGHKGMKLVFDWSDSMKTVSSQYSSSAGTVSWSVGQTFKIDPSIVGTSSSQQTINWGDERKLWHTTETNGTTEYWGFYYDGGQWIDDAWSIGGVKWHAGNNFATSYSTLITSGSDFSSWLDTSSGNKLYWIIADSASGEFTINSAQLGNNGAVSSPLPTWIHTVWNAGDSYPCIYSTPTDTIVGIATSHSGSWQLEVYHISSSTLAVLSKTTISTGSVPDACIALGLSSGYAMVYGPAMSAGADVVITSTNGNSWTAATTAPTTSPIVMASAVSVANTVDFASVTPGGDGYWSCNYPCSTTSSLQILAPSSISSSLDNIVLSTNSRDGIGGYSLTVTYHDLNNVWSRTSEDGGKTWTPAQIIDGSDTGIITSGSLQADYDYVSGNGIITTTDVGWVSGTSAPYTIWFPAFPVVVPSSSTTSDPWAQGGSSAYESYFSQLNEYVSPGNGLLGVAQTDLTLPGRSPVLSITRVYSQPSDFVGLSNPKVPYDYDNFTLSNLGVGWELDFPWIASTSTDTPTFLHPGNGMTIPILFNSSNIMEYHGALNFDLYKNSNGTYSLYTADGTRYYYVTGLKLALISSPDSPTNALIFSYNDPAGYISSILDPEGRSVTFSYNSNNMLASISYGGRTWSYTYSGSDLSSVTDPIGRVTHYYYDQNNPWLIAEIAYPTGAATYYEYNYGIVAPYVTSFAVYKQYEYSSNSQQTLARLNEYLFNMVDGSMVYGQVLAYNGSQALQGSTVFNFESVNSKFVQIQYQKDQSGNILDEVETDFTKLGQPNATILYSSTGTKLTSSVAHYDNWGNVNFTQDFNGHDVWYSYSGTKDQYQFGNGNTGLIQNFYTNSTLTKHVHDDLLGTGEFQDNANSNTPIETFYLYNQTEVLRSAELHTLPTGAHTWLITVITYDSLANPATMTDPLHQETCYTYSSAYSGAYLTSETVSGSYSCLVAPNISFSYTYDFTTGNILSQTDAKGNTTSYTYDPIGRILSMTNPAVNGVVTSASYSYNDATNVVTTTDQSGNISKSYYDGLARVIETQTFLSPSSPYSTEYYTYNWLNQVLTDSKPNGAVYKYTYDSLGRLTEVLNPDGSQENAAYNIATNTQTVTDGDGHVTQSFYDFMQNLIAVDEYWSSSGYNATAYSYNGVGDLVNVSGPNGGQQTTKYAYNDLNQLIKTTYPDGTTQTATYDADGNMVSSTDQMGRTSSYTYDYLGQLLSVNFPDGSSTTYTYDKNGNELTVTNAVDQVRYSYDALNQVRSEADTISGTQYTLSYAYDSSGNLQAITYPEGSTVTSSYDALGRTTKVASGSTIYASFTYNPDSTINTVTYGNGETTSYSYDALGRPQTITTSMGSTQELNLSYKYDGAGNVVSVGSESFAYDSLDRLTSSTGGWGTTTYSYDPAGNMAQKQNSSATLKSTYNNMNELVRSSTASTATTYSYDGDGNLVIKNDGTNVWTYIYNTQDELVKVLENGVLLQQNSYDGNGRRVEQTTGASTTLYLYTELNILYEKNLQTGAITKNIYADGMQVASLTSASTLFFHQDELGSTRLVTSGSSPTFSSDYVPYGVEYGSSGSTEFMYTGQQFDTATGLYYYNARFYDPNTGKFLTADPLGGTQSDPQSMNGYAYARDNPLTIVDPSGLSWWNPFTWTSSQWFLVGAAIGLTIAAGLQLGLDPFSDTADTSSISAAASSFAETVAAPQVAATSSQSAIDLSAISDTIDEGLANGVVRQMAAMLENLGPEPANSQEAGVWAQNFMKPLLQSLGYVAEQYRIQIGSRTLIADFFNPETGEAIDVKGGTQAFTAFAERQAVKYTVAELNGQLSRFLYIYVQNPWTGEIADSPAYLNQIMKFGIPFTHVFVY